MRGHKLLPALIAVLFSASVYGQGNSFLFRPDNSNFYVYGRGSDTFLIQQNKLTSLQIDKVLMQLSSGKRINSAADDPSGLAVAEKMDALLAGMSRESANDEDMRNLHNFVESVVAQDQELVKRIRELLLRSSGGIMTAEDRGYNQTEIDELLKQIDMNAKFSQFNKVNVIPELTSANLGLDAVDAVRNPDGSIDIVDKALERLTVRRVIQGVKSNVLTFRIEGRNFQYINLLRSESRILDEDMAEGISELIKNSVLLKSRYGLILKGR